MRLLVSILFLVSLSLNTHAATEKEILETVIKRIDVLEGKINDLEKKEVLLQNKKGQLEKLNRNQFIDYNIYDIFKAGCSGYLKMTTETQHQKEKSKEESNIPVLIRFDQNFRSIMAENRKKEVFPELSHSMNKIEFIRMDHFEWGNAPLIELGKVYEKHKEKSGGTVSKGVYDYKYQVTKSENKKLEVIFKAKTDIKYEGLQISSEVKDVHVECEGKTIEELDQLSSVKK